MSRSDKYIESSTSSVQIARTVQDKLPAADDTESRYAKSCQYPFDGQDPYDGAIKLLATVCGNELEHNDAMDSVRGCISRRDSLVTGQEGLVVYILYCSC
jgi:hypothetical protein